MKNIKTIFLISYLGVTFVAHAQQHEMPDMNMSPQQKMQPKQSKKASQIEIKKADTALKPTSKKHFKANATNGMPGMNMSDSNDVSTGNKAKVAIKDDSDAMQNKDMPMSGQDMRDMNMGSGSMADMKMITQPAKPGDTIKSTSSTLNDHLIHPGKRVYYDLNIGDTIVNYAGKRVRALAINGQIPGPVLRFTEGDTAYIRVHNSLNKTTSVHWHGILVPNKYDGVPYVSTVPIEPGMTFTNIIPIHQTGTYWYHTHTELDEQAGLYGPIVIQPQVPQNNFPEQVFMLSDWTNYQPKEVLRMLKRGSDWFSIQRGSVLSYGGAIGKGYLGDKLKLDWMRMPAMDLVDVKYDRFLANGKGDQDLTRFKAGETVKMRIINGSASSYFWLNYAGGPMTVVAADGLAVKPVQVDKILIGTAETYDVLIKIPASGKYEFRATAQDITGKVSAWFGSGREVKASDIPKVPYYRFTHTFNQMMGVMNMPMNSVPNSKVKIDGLQFSKSDGMMKMGNMQMNGKDSSRQQMQDMNMPGMKMDQMAEMSSARSQKEKQNKGKMPGMPMQEGMKNMDMGGMDMKMKEDGKGTPMGPGQSMLLGLGGKGKILSYDMLEANSSTVTSGVRTVRTYHLYLTGSMLRYTWFINNKALSEADRLLIRKGEIVRFVFHNTTMMEHPMHLHGHFFRVLNAKGDSAPLKHTVSIEPMKVQTIEFLADEAHDWFFHCHMLYHMMSGMARVVRYEDAPSNSDVAKYQPKNPLINDDRQFYTWAQLSFHSQTSIGSIFISNTRYEFNANYRFSYDGRYEIDPRFQRYLDNNQYLAAYMGGNFEQTEKGRLFSRKGDNSAVVGLRYLLPLFVQTDARISSKGQFRLTVSREDIPISTRLYMGASYNTDNEFQVDTRYILTKSFAVSASYDNQYGFGGGLTLIY
jgi:CopA family copper-resistance protein